MKPGTSDIMSAESRHCLPRRMEQSWHSMREESLPEADSDQIDLFLRRSFDGGRSFGDVQVVATKDGWVSGNPAPVQDRTTGTIWLVFCRNQTEKISTLDVPRSVWVTSSVDDGETWNEPKEITASVKPAHWAAWYATGPCHGIQMRSGRIVIPANHREKKQHVEDEDDYDHSHIIYSDDHGGKLEVGRKRR